MVVLIGYAVALGCIFGAYIIHGGNIGVILHAIPTEMMAIGGGALEAKKRPREEPFQSTGVCWRRQART